MNRAIVMTIYAGLCAGALLDGYSAFARPGTAASQVLAQEQKYTQGILNGDARLLDSVWADSFVDTNGDAVLRDKREMLAAIARGTPPTSITESHRRISVYGSTAVVTVEFIVQGAVNGRPYSVRGRATDVWALQDGTWRCVAAHSSEARS